jgi:hypothetical protein
MGHISGRVHNELQALNRGGPDAVPTNHVARVATYPHGGGFTDIGQRTVHIGIRRTVPRPYLAAH